MKSVYIEPTNHLKIMLKSSNKHIFSPSDLILYMRSPFASWMARLELDAPEQLIGIDKDQDQMMQLLAKQGNQHESQYLAFMKTKFGAANVMEIERSNSAATETLKAMKAGYSVIFQAYLQRDEFNGYADFLVRREGQSKFGNYYYEVWDTKLSKSTKPYFIVQLCCYSWMLEAIQGRVPDYAAVILGNQCEDRYRLPAYYSYFLSLKRQFLQFQQDFQSGWQHMPDIALCKDFGVWSTFAKQKLTDSDSLALVANIRKSQIKKLNDVGINTLTDLTTTALTSVAGIPIDSLAKLKAQAAIQWQSRGQAKPLFSVLQTEAGKGLSALPPKSPLDVYFDIEGHPLTEGGLEYLWGVSFEDATAAQGKQYAFKDWWAHDQEQEKQAFEGFIDWAYARWQTDPAMHIYHYASYEITAINKMANRYQTRKDEVAELLINCVFVDLYKIVRSGLLVGEPKYSIKNIEHLYRGKRTTIVGNGGDSVVFYENWREQGGAEDWKTVAHGYSAWSNDPDHFDWSAWSVLNEIRDYNIDDCESTLELVAWLRAQQIEHNIRFSTGKDEVVDDNEKTERQIANAEKRQALIDRQQRLIAQFENDSTLKNDPQAKLLVSLIHFYDRERKPKIFSYFQRLEKSDEELFEDDSVVFDLTLQTEQVEEGKLCCTALFDANQSVRKDKFVSATIKGTKTKASKIEFKETDQQHGEVSFQIDPNQAESLQQIPLTLFGEGDRVNTDTLENRLCEIIEAYFETRQLNKLLSTVVNRANPRFIEHAPCLPITRQQYLDNDRYLQAIIAAVQAMDETCLCIQGPPGAGKTYTAKHIIRSLVEQGKRIGIMSNSHAAIMNLLLPLVAELPNIPMAKVGGYGSQKEFKELFNSDSYEKFEYRTSMKFTNKQPYEYFQIVGGTVYAFANNEAYKNSVDYLFVDEASQVALANLLAVSGAAKNIILMGDQMQLAQPIQGSHPEESGKSALEYMLGDHAVIPEAKGIFLERTFRMHPKVCKPLSEIVYEGRLQSDAATSHQAVVVENPNWINKQNGILCVPVAHEGNTQSSEEEAVVIQQLINELKTAIFIDKNQQQRKLSAADILVIAPYNMQVNLLKEKLSGDLKIGTIDKFQGQEAPVVIISMAVSDVEDSPRGLDFIFDINRLNVAVSRAQALAIIVANKKLGECAAESIDKVKMIGFYSSFLSS